MKDSFGQDFEIGAIYYYQTSFSNLAVCASTFSKRDHHKLHKSWVVVLPFSWWTDIKDSTTVYRGIKSHVKAYKLIKVDHNLLSDAQLKEANMQRSIRLRLPPLVKNK